MERVNTPLANLRGTRGVVPRRWRDLIVDVIGLVNLAGLVLTGIVMRWVLPHGGGHYRHGWAGPVGADIPRRAREFLGLHRHDWGDIHTAFALVFTGVVILHLVLHWRWVVAVCRRLGSPNG